MTTTSSTLTRSGVGEFDLDLPDGTCHVIPAHDLDRAIVLAADGFGLTGVWFSTTADTAEFPA